MTRGLGGTWFSPSSFPWKNNPRTDEQQASALLHVTAVCSQTPAKGRGRNSRDIPGPIPGQEDQEMPWPLLGQGSPIPPLRQCRSVLYTSKHFPLLSVMTAFFSCVSAGIPPAALPPSLWYTFCSVTASFNAFPLYIPRYGWVVSHILLPLQPKSLLATQPSFGSPQWH